MFLMILLEKVIPVASGLGSNICQCKAWWRLRDARRSCPTIGKVARLKKKFLNWGEVVRLEDRLRDFRRGCVTLGKVMWWKERMEFFRSSTKRHGPVCLWQYWAGYLVHFLAILVFHSAVDADWSSLKVLAFLHLAAHGLAAAGCSGPEFGPGEYFFVWVWSWWMFFLAPQVL